MDTPEVSCVIVCYHRHESIRIMTAALVDPRIEVIVVNAEADPEVEAIATASGATVVPIFGDPGYATAVNLGARHATSEFVILMNDDLRVDVEVVMAMKEAVASGQGDVVVPAVLDSEGAPEATIKAAPTPVALIREVLLLPDHPVPFLQGRIRVEKWRAPAVPEEIESCGPPMLAVRTQFVRDRPLPEDYFLYWDEVEWFWKIREVGARVIYRPDLKVMHIGGRRDVSAAKSELITRNAVRCVLRTQGRGAALAAFVIILAYNVRLVAVDWLRSRLRRDQDSSVLQARIAGLKQTPASFREI
ncbi:MAG TPA: glycosyltransferase, partial [Acidimicrobiales bacterium]